MKVLLIIAHVDPNKEATSYRLAKAAEEALVKAGNEVKVTDIVHEGFDKTATPGDFKELANGGKNFFYLANQGNEANYIEAIQKQHDLLKWATNIIVFSPMWYYRMPACFYAWIERVFTVGFSHDNEHTLDNGLLKGRKVSFVITCGGAEAHYNGKGYAPLEACLYSTTYAFRYAGIKPTRTFGYFLALSPDTKANEAKYIEKFKKAVVKIDSWPLLPSVQGHPKDGEPNDAELIARLNPLTLEDILGA